MRTSQTLVTIGTASRRTGVPEWRLRSWDTSGLLRAIRSESGYRLYSADHIARAREIVDELGDAPHAAAMPAPLSLSAIEGDVLRSGAADPSASRRLHLIRRLLHVSDETADLAYISRAALRQALEVVGATSGALTRANLARQQYDVIAVEGIPSDFLAAGPWRLNEGLAGEVFSLREPTVVHDLRDEVIGRRNEVERAGLRSYACVPIVRGSLRLGLIEVFAAQPGRFATHHLADLELIAAVMAPAMEVDMLRTENAALRKQRTMPLRLLSEHVEKAIGHLDLVGLLRETVVTHIREMRGVEVSIVADSWASEVPADTATALFLLIQSVADEFAVRSHSGVHLRLGALADGTYLVALSAVVADDAGDPRLWSSTAGGIIDELGGSTSFSTGRGRTSLEVRIPRNERADLLQRLTKRERATLEALKTGLGNKELAAMLSITTKTLQNHLTSIYRKLHVAGRGEAILLLRRRNAMETERDMS